MRVEMNNRMYDFSFVFMNHDGGVVSATLSDSTIFAVKTDVTIWVCGKNSARYAFCGKGKENQYTLVNTGLDIK